MPPPSTPPLPPPFLLFPSPELTPLAESELRTGWNAARAMCEYMEPARTRLGASIFSEPVEYRYTGLVEYRYTGSSGVPVHQV
ncbi:hypothetical protein RRG08_008091 [Elysia crispata]|uniref:Uncharacterized protein n=1 Tax=Elysia crispata TaxID=231223 RepID=A0AAE1CW38_9GAST|nr:hypothetical protein RRG08_008091 [Elysia crispata]